jgi:hypothetical protein
MSAMDDASDQETQRDSERAGRFDQRVNTRRRMTGACRRLTAPGVPIDIDLLAPFVQGKAARTCALATE